MFTMYIPQQPHTRFYIIKYRKRCLPAGRSNRRPPLSPIWGGGGLHTVAEASNSGAYPRVRRLVLFVLQLETSKTSVPGF